MGSVRDVTGGYQRHLLTLAGITLARQDEPGLAVTRCGVMLLIPTLLFCGRCRRFPLGIILHSVSALAGLLSLEQYTPVTVDRVRPLTKD